MLVCVLGPLRLHSDSGQAVEVSGVRLRRLLTLLAATAPGYVSATALAAAVWEDDTSQLPGDIANALQTLVSRARRLLRAPTMLEQRAGGYRLVDIETDISRFASLAKAGREALNVDDNAAASTHFEAALRLWRGEPFDDLGHIDSVAAMRSRLDEQHSEVLAGRISADIARGRAAEVIAELREQISRYPLREQFSALLMQALNQAGRPAEALEAYEQTRLHLSDELGADPGPHLREQHAAALNSWDLAVRERPRPHNLKAQVTTFLGRDQEVQQVTVMLESSRLTTVVGPGGAGKTRLATVVARQLSEQFADGVWFVELAPVTEAANLAQAVLQSLGEGGLALLEAPTEVRRLNSTERLLGTLAAAECLLLIDNCEHLIGPVASLVDAILARAPGVRVMATSREPLGVYGETLCMLAPLPVPEVGASVEEAGRFSAVALFVDRATAMQSSFRLDDRSAAAVIEIVRRLDGLPLAIELAAARLRVLPVDEVATRLVDRFRLLSGGSRSAMPRHRTLRAVVEWSWELLSPARTPPHRAAIGVSRRGHP